MFIITVNDSVRLLLSALRFQQQAEKLYSESPQPHIFLHHNFFENIFPVTEKFLCRSLDTNSPRQLEFNASRSAVLLFISKTKRSEKSA